MRKDSNRDLQRVMAHFVLNPIRGMVESGSLSKEAAMAEIGKTLGFYDGHESPEYTRFRKNSGLIYENEPQERMEYVTNDSFGRPVGKYTIVRPSEHGVNTLFKLYQHLSGEKYNTPKQLKALMRRLVNGKRVLELGCGPGYNLKIFKDLGANVSGVDIREQFAKVMPETDVRLGDAERLDEIFKDEQFDIIYSRDFLCQAVVDNSKAARMAKTAYEHTVKGGIGVHQIIHKEIPLPMLLLEMQLADREHGCATGTMEETFWGFGDDEFREALYTNRCSIDPQDLLRSGFAVQEYSIENDELNVVVTK